MNPASKDPWIAKTVSEDTKGLPTLIIVGSIPKELFPVINLTDALKQTMM